MRRFTEVKDSNRSMIYRELAADVIQNILKYTAYSLSGSQAVKAELMRAAIDTLNHIVMLKANSRSKQKADEHYNYGNPHEGYSKFKNMAVLFPGICFAGSGFYNLITPLVALSSSIPVCELTLTPLSLGVL